MMLDGGTYTSTGKNGCPAIYSTADITVKNAVCVSTGDSWIDSLEGEISCVNTNGYTLYIGGQSAAL